jgi:hypothetical protein
VASLAEADEPEAAARLRDTVAPLRAGPPERWLAEHASVPEHLGDLEHRLLRVGQVNIPGLQWSLDPGLVAERALLPGLSPLSDLIVGSDAGHDRVVVEALRAPGTRHDALRGLRARLVDPAARRVLDAAAFRQAGSWVRAEISPPSPAGELSETWIEVVDDEHRPVRSARLRRVRRALRWADAALRAEQGPAGLAPQFTAGEWAALAVLAWERCRCDWQEAGDTDRAYLGAVRLAGPDPQARAAEAPSQWAAGLAGRPRLRERAFLAEDLGC